MEEVRKCSGRGCIVGNIFFDGGICYCVQIIFLLLCRGVSYLMYMVFVGPVGLLFCIFFLFYFLLLKIFLFFIYFFIFLFFMLYSFIFLGGGIVGGNFLV